MLGSEPDIASGAIISVPSRAKNEFDRLEKVNVQR